jgi:anti-anti-sigma factor
MTNRALLSEPEVRVSRLRGEIAVISLLGEHDLATAWEVRNAVALALEHGRHVVVDLSETELIDSSIVDALFDSKQVASKHRRRLSLQVRAHAEVVERVLGISGVLESFPVYATRTEAIDAVRQTPDWTTEHSPVQIGSRSTGMERRPTWDCSWL